MYAGIESEKCSLMSEQKLEKKYGQSPVFVASTLLEDGGTLKASPASLLTEAIHVISCGYEDKTDWGKEVNNTFYFHPLVNNEIRKSATLFGSFYSSPYCSLLIFWL